MNDMVFLPYVGKYLIKFAQFPLQRDTTPSSFTQREKQSTIPTNIRINTFKITIVWCFELCILFLGL